MSLPLGTLHTTLPSAGLYTGSVAGHGTHLQLTGMMSATHTRFANNLQRNKEHKPAVDEQILSVRQSGWPRGARTCALVATHGSAAEKGAEVSTKGDVQ